MNSGPLLKFYQIHHLIEGTPYKGLEAVHLLLDHLFKKPFHDMEKAFCWIYWMHNNSIDVTTPLQ